MTRTVHRACAWLLLAVAAGTVVAQNALEADIGSDGVVTQSNEERFQLNGIVSGEYRIHIEL